MGIFSLFLIIISRRSISDVSNISGYSCRKYVFQALYGTFWPENGRDRIPLTPEVQIAPLSPLLFVPWLVSLGRLSSCRQSPHSLKRYSRSTWPLERCPPMLQRFIHPTPALNSQLIIRLKSKQILYLFVTEIRDNSGSKLEKQAFLEVTVSNFNKLGLQEAVVVPKAIF